MNSFKRNKSSKTRRRGVFKMNISSRTQKRRIFKKIFFNYQFFEGQTKVDFLKAHFFKDQQTYFFKEIYL